MRTNRKTIKFLQDPRLVEERQVYDGDIIQVYRNQLEIEEGVVVGRDLIHHQPAVAILATTDNQEVVLVSQYRPAVADKIYEIPAGLMDLQDDSFEDPLQAAKRELEEETGFRAASWKKIGTYVLSPGFSDEAITLYHASDLSKVDQPLAQDAHENVSAGLFDKKSIIEWLEKDLCQDIKTALALNYWLNQGGNL